MTSDNKQRSKSFGVRMETASEILQEARSLGVFQRAIADRSGLSSEYVNSLRQGRSRGTEETRERLRDAIVTLADEIEKFDPERDDPDEFRESVGLNLSKLAERHGSIRQNVSQIFISGFRTAETAKAMKRCLKQLARELRQIAR